MSDQAAAQVNGGPPAVGPPPADLLSVMQQALEAAQVCAQKARGAKDARDAKDYAQAGLLAAQTFVTLDPTRLQGGDTAATRVASIPPPPPTKDADRDGKLGEK